MEGRVGDRSERHLGPKHVPEAPDVALRVPDFPPHEAEQPSGKAVVNDLETRIVGDTKTDPLCPGTELVVLSGDQRLVKPAQNSEAHGRNDQVTGAHVGIARVLGETLEPVPQKRIPAGGRRTLGAGDQPLARDQSWEYS